MVKKSPATSLPQLYRIEDIAEKLKLSPAFLYRDLAAKRLQGRKFGRALRFRVEDVNDYILKTS